MALPAADRTFIDLGAVSRPAADQDITHLPTAAVAKSAPTATPRAAVSSSIELRIDLGDGIVLTITRR